MGTPVTIGGDTCDVTIAEVVCWDRLLTPAELLAMVTAQRIKWECPAGAVALPPGASASASLLPTGLPTPTLWLDASHSASLFADAAATVPAVSNGMVRVWRDRSSAVCCCRFAAAGPAEWKGSLNGRPLVTCMGTGTLDVNPLAAGLLSNGRTVVAVWRLEHPSQMSRVPHRAGTMPVRGATPCRWAPRRGSFPPAAGRRR